MYPMNQPLKTWANNQAEEDAMHDDHYYMWCAMIDEIKEPGLQDKAVLDYGCNQGGFLKALFHKRPYKSALGVDVALSSIAYANQNKGNIPASYEPAEALENMSESFDVAFSHEVLYLLPDLKAHAQLIKNVLRPRGRYYAAIGCHIENPHWQEWKNLIAGYSNISVQDYSLDDYARPFFELGFQVSARPFSYQGFVPLKAQNDYFPKISDSLHYHTSIKTLFCFEKGGA
jgi:SAM-dependent methyltransferase